MRRYYEGLKFLFLKLTGFVPSQRFRHFLYKLIWRIKIDRTAVIYAGAEIRSPENLQIGKYTSIGHGAILDARKGLIIGDCVNISTGVWIWSLQHDYQDKNFVSVGDKVVVEDYAWLSCRVIVLPGVKIGKGAVVAAGAVVTKDVEPFTVVAGVPAKKIASRSENLEYLPGKNYLPFV